MSDETVSAPSPTRQSGSTTPGLEFLSGFQAMLPVILAALPIGVTFGALMTQAGHTPAAAILMSASVFAGAAQFVALELWTTPVPILTLALATLVVNARHVLMGVAIAGHMERFGRTGRVLSLLFMTDETWAMALGRVANAVLTPAYYAGLAGSLYAAWVGGTAIGAMIGGGDLDVTRWGLDFVFAAVFLAMLAGMWRGRRRSGFVWVITAGVAVAVDQLATPTLAILSGALAGVASAAILAARRQED